MIRFVSFHAVFIGHTLAPVRVYVTVATNAMSQIDAVSQSFQLDMYIYLAWRDDRLNSTWLDSQKQHGGIIAQTNFASGQYWWPAPEVRLAKIGFLLHDLHSELNHWDTTGPVPLLQIRLNFRCM
jgi:hypothetical protein